MNPTDYTDYTKCTQAEQAFIDQRTRSLLVEWCHSVFNTINHVPKMNPGDEVFIQYALDKGWVSKDRTRILSAGWKTAASFLKR